MVLQLVRLRVDQLRSRTVAGTFERPLVGYLEHPPSYFFDGLQTAERAFGYIAAQVHKNGAKAALVMMPARFQIRDSEYQTLSNTAERAGGKLLRNAATERFATALARLDEPTLDLLPIFSSLQDPEGLYFVGNGHLSARGHRVVAEALRDFLNRNRLTATTAR
jgi:lysophospholipase L1-like esterase